MFLLAASDLIVGVSNDAVNFLNSAIGSRVASFKVIMAIAAVGVLVGAVFSSGMMEVARKGIFNPGEFYFSEIMIIFLAVMVTDILLLDAYNTIGLPTSTTVSIVFELLGAAVAMGVIKIIHSVDELTISQFINSSKALAIISGILLSVGIAFTVGALIQYLIRIVFSFNFKKRMKYFGAIWGGIAFSAMTYFILIKGAKGASFMSDDIKEWININSLMIILGSFVGWTVLLQLLYTLFRINILRLIVLVGTFALAMAFAGNDLVNFIGVPIAGYNSYEIFMANPGADPNAMIMADLAGKVPTPTLFLIIAGVIMVLTLYFSKKAKSVVKTSLDLSRQDEGEERFRSTWFSKNLVRTSIHINGAIRKVMPRPVMAGIERQFEPYDDVANRADPPEFDLIRASVTLTVASVLIAFGTSLKLPLSTTYVTFMVAMGTSLSDKAWGRESASYRIAGVVAVIGGWFLTALSAFTVAFILVFVFNYGGIIAIFIVLLLVAYLLYRTHLHHKKAKEELEEDTHDVKSISEENLAEKSTNTIIKNLNKVSVEYGQTIECLASEDIKQMKKVKKNVDSMTAKTKYLKDHINIIVEKLREESIDSAYYFVQVLDYMREILHSITHITRPALDHIDNNHKPLLPAQVENLKQLHMLITKMMDLVVDNMKSGDFSQQDELQLMMAEAISTIELMNKSLIKKLKRGEIGTKNSILILSIFNESKNMVLQIVNLYKSQRDFVNYKNGSVEE